MIKATFQNMGPIQDAELELGDLTIIAGQNNTGKTYLAYTLYDFLYFLTEGELHPHGWGEIIMDDAMEHETIEKISHYIEKDGSTKIHPDEYKDISCFLTETASLFFSSVLFSQFFSASDDEFKGSVVNIETDYEIKQAEQIIVFKHSRGEGYISATSLDDSTVVFQLQGSEGMQPSFNLIRKGVVRLLWRIWRANYPRPFILSAERFGVSLFYKELDFTKNRLVEELQILSGEEGFDTFEFLEKESARYAKPIKENINFTRDLPRIQKKRGTLPTNNQRSVRKMMVGYYEVRNEEIRFISARRKNNKFDIPLHLASSSVRGVSDLYFYLKHVAEPGQLLIIDEPESHLSPTNQVLMARLLAFCVNSGLKVLVTTHSDYLIKEINNLVMLNQDFEGKEGFLRRHKKDYSADDRLDPASVKAYICEDGGLTACSVDAAGIDMPVFDDAINKINKISMELVLHTTPEDLQND